MATFNFYWDNFLWILFAQNVDDTLSIFEHVRFHVTFIHFMAWTLLYSLTVCKTKWNRYSLLNQWHNLEWGWWSWSMVTSVIMSEVCMDGKLWIVCFHMGCYITIANVITTCGKILHNDDDIWFKSLRVRSTSLLTHWVGRFQDCDNTWFFHGTSCTVVS